MQTSTVMNFKSASIDTETDPVIASDPDNIITSVACITDIYGYRQIQITATGNIGAEAQVTWYWNGRPITATVSISDLGGP